MGYFSLYGSYFWNCRYVKNSGAPAARTKNGYHCTLLGAKIGNRSVLTLVPGFLFEKMRLAADAATCPNHATTLVTEQDGSLKLEPCCQDFSMNKFMSLLND